MKRAEWIVAVAVAAWLTAPAPANAQCGPNFFEQFNPEIDRFECAPLPRSLQEESQRQQQAEQLRLFRRQERDARNRSISQQRQIRLQKARQRRLLFQQQRLQAR